MSEQEPEPPVGKPLEYLDVAEFVQDGYLHEVNRRFLHPLGLALSVLLHADGRYELGPIWDCRDDPEGLRYGVEEDFRRERARKAANVARLEDERRPVREALLGYWVQPIADPDRVEADPNQDVI